MPSCYRRPRPAREDPTAAGSAAGAQGVVVLDRLGHRLLAVHDRAQAAADRAVHVDRGGLARLEPLDGARVRQSPVEDERDAEVLGRSPPEIPYRDAVAGGAGRTAGRDLDGGNDEVREAAVLHARTRDAPGPEEHVPAVVVPAVANDHAVGASGREVLDGLRIAEPLDSRA